MTYGYVRSRGIDRQGYLAYSEISGDSRLQLEYSFKGPSVSNSAKYRAVCRQIFGPHWRHDFRGVSDGNCVDAGMPVMMADGSESRISDIREGDYVMSHLGTQSRVITTTAAETRGLWFDFEVYGLAERFLLTKHHPLLVRRLSGVEYDNKTGNVFVFDVPRWRSANNLLVEDYVLLPWAAQVNLQLYAVQHSQEISRQSVNTDDGERYSRHVSKAEVETLTFRDKLGFWLPVTEIRPVRRRAVACNLEVDHAKSFLVSGIAVHNCLPPESSAAMRQLRRLQKLND